MKKLFHSPILFIAFNRPDRTVVSFEKIRKIRPSKLFISIDGPRADGDTLKTLQVKQIVSNIDWPCEIHKLYRKKNLGCKLAVSSAITWFFESVEEGIIIEDDIVADVSFFNFCEAMLKKYKDDERIMMITGTNYLSNLNFSSDYFFSKSFTIWGWATWKRAWNKYDLEMSLWDNEKVKKQLRHLMPNYFSYLHQKRAFDMLKNGEYDLWDIQWVFTCLYNNGLCITPSKNLVSNIGYEGTYSNRKIKGIHDLKRYPLSKSIIHSNIVVPNFKYDLSLHYRWTTKAVFFNIIFDFFKKTSIFNLIKKTYYKIL